MNSDLTPEQRKSNLRLAWVIAAIALLLFIGFIAKSAVYAI